MQTTKSKPQEKKFDNLRHQGSVIYADVNGGGNGNVVALATINESSAEAKYGPLFAAAPDLLDALDSMIEFIDQYATLRDTNGKNLEEDFSGFRDVAVAAIRKASNA